MHCAAGRQLVGAPKKSDDALKHIVACTLFPRLPCVCGIIHSRIWASLTIQLVLYGLRLPICHCAGGAYACSFLVRRPRKRRWLAALRRYERNMVHFGLVICHYLNFDPEVSHYCDTVGRARCDLYWPLVCSATTMKSRSKLSMCPHHHAQSLSPYYPSPISHL